VLGLEVPRIVFAMVEVLYRGYKLMRVRMCMQSTEIPIERKKEWKWQKEGR